MLYPILGEVPTDHNSICWGKVFANVNKQFQHFTTLLTLSSTGAYYCPFPMREIKGLNPSVLGKSRLVKKLSILLYMNLLTLGTINIKF